VSCGTEVASLRVPEGTIKKLKMLAHRISLERGEDVTWNMLVKELISKHLLDDEVEREPD
jgi:hypothetical protein